jgi:hypothetical protein
MASREKGISNKLAEYTLKVLQDKDPKAKLSDEQQKLCDDTAKNLTETKSFGPFTLGASLSVTFPHNLNYIPSVTIVNSSDGLSDLRIIFLTDTGVTIYNAGVLCSATCYVYCH